MPPTNYYSSGRVRQLIGVTQRQLQWWAEHDLVIPRVVEHSRKYSDKQVLTVFVIAELRKKGLSIQKIRGIVKVARLTGEYLVVAGNKVYDAETEHMAFTVTAAAKGPAYVLHLRGIRLELQLQ